MFRNYFTIALRYLRRHKGHSFINVAGLAIGMACCLLIFFWVQDEVAFDGFHENSDEIFRVIRETRGSGQTNHFATVSNALGPALVEEYPEIINFTRYKGVLSNWHVKYEEKSFVNNRLGTADPSYFEIFKFPFVKGNPKTALMDKFSVVITEAFAKKFFDDDEPMGKVLKIEGGDYKVTGVIKNVPSNSHMQFDFMLPVINMEHAWGEDLKDWKRESRFPTYIQLEKNSSVSNVNQKISDIVTRHNPESKSRLYLQPLKDVHLHSNFKNDKSNVAQGSITYIYIFSLVALCILLIACINFMNLSTARSENRAKEVSMRKVTGAQKKDIVIQFIGESIIFSFIALIFALILVYLFLPTFNSLSGKELGLDLSVKLLGVLLVIALFTGIVAGSYPAFFLSSFQPLKVFTGISSLGKRRGTTLRKVLVMIQFAITIILIIATTVIDSQIHYINNKDLGMNAKNVLTFWRRGDFGQKYDAVKNELLQNPNIVSITNGIPPRGTGGGTTNLSWEGKDPNEKIRMYRVLVDHDFLKTFGMKMAKGRFFSKELETDRTNYVLNEAAVEAMGVKSPVGMRFNFEDLFTRQPVEGTIIGVIKNFHQDSLHTRIPPLVLSICPRVFHISIRISPENVSETMRFLEDKWEKFVPGFPFVYEFLDERIGKYYAAENKAEKIIRYFTFITIFISCLGMLGLVSYVAQRRTKEIGIRKVIGAPTASIVLLLSKEYVKCVITALILASPIAWHVMSKWLENFAYRISISWLMFLLAGVMSLLLTLLIISYQTIKAARANPVDSLRYE